MANHDSELTVHNFTKQHVQIVVKAAKYPSNQMEANQFSVEIVLKMLRDLTREEQKTDLIERCLMQCAVTAVIIAKFLSDQLKEEKFCVQTVLKRMDQSIHENHLRNKASIEMIVLQE